MRCAIHCGSVCVLIAAPLAALSAEPSSRFAAPAPGESAPRETSQSPVGEIEPLSLDEPAAPLEPREPRTEADRNRIEALSLFAAGRMKEQQGNLPEALRLYQRAARYAPRSLPILRETVRVAFELDRNAEAVRYALMAVELDASDPLWLRQLAMVLSEQGDLEGALELYERALALQSDKQVSGFVLLTMEAGKLYYLLDRAPQAADAFALVIASLAEPEKYGLDAALTKKLLGDSPAQLYLLFAESFLSAGRLDEAQQAYEKANELDSKPALHAFHLARVHSKRGQAAEALDQLDRYFESHETAAGTAPYALFAELLSTLGQEQELVERLEALSAGDPDNAPLKTFLAGRYFQAGDFERAERLFSMAVEQAPSPEVYQGLVSIYRQSRKADKLVEILGKVAGETGGLELVNQEAKAIAEDGELLSALLDAARNKHQADADSLGHGARLAMGLLALAGQQFKAADEFFTLALKVKPQDAAELFFLWGRSLLLADKYAEAASVFQRALDERAAPSDDPTFHFLLSGALAMEGRTEEALSAARTAASLGNGAAQYESRIPWILYHARRYDDAAQEYRNLIERFDGQYESDEVREALKQARLVLSNIAVIQGNMTQAEEWLEQVLDEYPGDISAMNDLGYLWADQGKNLARALEMVQQAVAAEPDNTAYRDSLGWALYKLGRHEEAVRELERAASDEKPDAVILEHLGDAYLAAGRIADARQAWQRALTGFESDKQSEQAQKVKEKLENNAQSTD